MNLDWNFNYYSMVGKQLIRHCCDWFWSVAEWLLSRLIKERTRHHAVGRSVGGSGWWVGCWSRRHPLLLCRDFVHLRGRTSSQFTHRAGGGQRGRTRRRRRRCNQYLAKLLFCETVKIVILESPKSRSFHSCFTTDSGHIFLFSCSTTNSNNTLRITRPPNKSWIKSRGGASSSNWRHVQGERPFKPKKWVEIERE